METLGNSLRHLWKTQKRVQCHESKDFGHIAAKCGNTLKRSTGKKAMNITWSKDEDKESVSDKKDNTDNNQVTFLTANLQPVADTDLLSSVSQTY